MWFIMVRAGRPIIVTRDFFEVFEIYRELCKKLDIPPTTHRCGAKIAEIDYQNERWVIWGVNAPKAH